MSATADRIARNLQHVRDQMARAAERAGRPSGATRLVAVTKGAGLEEIEALIELGQSDLGENRVAQLAERAEAVAARHGPEAVRWHMIGHLQRRKVRDLLPHAAMIHGVDSLRLGREIARRAEAAGIEGVAALLEVNVSGEAQKFGLAPEEVAGTLGELASERPWLDVRGLMTMAPLVAEAEAARPVFRALRELRDRLNDAGAWPGPLEELSMGMSQDYAVAVEEGATLVRVGTALFA